MQHWMTDNNAKATLHDVDGRFRVGIVEDTTKTVALWDGDRCVSHPESGWGLWKPWKDKPPKPECAWTPEAFAKEMQGAADFTGEDKAGMWEASLELMCQALEGLGYADGVKVFRGLQR
jgi:hypothetical protein